MNHFFRKKQPRELSASLSDTYSREEVLDILGRELAMPGKTMDMQLIRECYLHLDPDALTYPAEEKEATWRRIQATIQEQRPRRIPRKRLVLVLGIALLLVLATVAVALVLRGVSLTFFYDVLGKRPPAITEMGEGLVQYDLARAEFEHSIVEVREAVYDGHQLRVVYAVRDKDGAELTSADKYPQPIIAAAREDGLHGADSIYVDGTPFNILEVHEQPSDTPGEMLYYLSVKLEEQGYVPERTMMVGLPIAGDTEIIGAATTPPGMTREEFVEEKTVPEGLLFPVRIDLGNNAMRLANAANIQTEMDAELVVDAAEFSPLECMVELTVRSTSEQIDAKALSQMVIRWMGARLYGPDGVEIGGYIDVRESDVKAQVSTIRYYFYPLVKWPEEMIFAIPDKDGRPSETERITLLFES